MTTSPLARRLASLAQWVEARYPYLVLFFVGASFVAETRTLRDIFYLLVLPATLFVIARNRSVLRRVVASRTALAAGLFLLLQGVLSLVFMNQGLADALEEWRHGVLIAVFLLALALMVERIAEPGQIGRLLALVMALGALLGGVLVLWSYPFNHPLAPRLAPLPNTSNIIYGATMIGLAASAVIARVLILPRTAEGRARFRLSGPELLERSLWLAALLGLVVLLWMSETRGALLALALATVAVAAFQASLWLTLVVVAILGGGLAVYGLFWPETLLSFLARGDAYRLDIWMTSLTLIAERPFFGYGPENGLILAHVGEVAILDAHNVFLQRLLDGGVVLLAAFCLLLASLGRTALSRQRRAGDSLMIALFVFVLVSFVFHFGDLTRNAGPIWMIAWLPVGLAIGFELRRAKERAAAREQLLAAQP